MVMSSIISFGQELLLVQVSALCNIWKNTELSRDVYTLVSPLLTMNVRKLYLYKNIRIEYYFSPFKNQLHKVVTLTQAIHRQIADELFESVWPFCGVGAWRVKSYKGIKLWRNTLSFYSFFLSTLSFFLSFFLPFLFCTMDLASFLCFKLEGITQPTYIHFITFHINIAV